MVCVHINPMRIVPMSPTNSPALLKALGIAKIPVPNELLSR